RRNGVWTDHERGIALESFGQLRQLIREALPLAAELPCDHGGEREQYRERSKEYERSRYTPRHRVLEPRDEGRERERQDAGDAGDHQNVPERAQELDGQTQRDEDREDDERDKEDVGRPPVDERRDTSAPRRPTGPPAALKILDDVVLR